MLKETEQRTAELAVINSVQEGLAKELDMQGIYELVGDRVQMLFNAQAVIIASFDPVLKFEHFNYVFENGQKVSIPPRPINNLRQDLLDNGQTIYLKTRKQLEVIYGGTGAGTSAIINSSGLQYLYLIAAFISRVDKELQKFVQKKLLIAIICALRACRARKSLRPTISHKLVRPQFVPGQRLSNSIYTLKYIS